MDFIIGLIALFLGLGLVGLFALWAQDVIPDKINESEASGEISKFENSPVTEYAVSKIIDRMGVHITNACRGKTDEYVTVNYTITVSSHDIHAGDWHFSFFENRYPNLNSDADRTALAMAIAKKAIPKLRRIFAKDLCGSTDVKITYSKNYHKGINYSFTDTKGDTSITFYYKASNLYYEELKSW